MSKIDEKIRKDGTRVTADQIKSIELDGLQLLDRICKENSITYFLIAGTLLGAVRHKGFIPWDDDLDVALLRDDYDRLVELCADGKSDTDEWKFENYKNEPKHIKYFMRMVHKKTALVPCRQRNGHYFGVPIDIFPLDAFEGESEERALVDWDYAKNYYNQAIDQCRPYTVLVPGLRNFVKKHYYNVYYKLIGGKKERKVLTQIYGDLEKHSRDRDNSTFVGQYACYYRVVWKRTDLVSENGEVKYLEFENGRYPVPYNYDEVLKKAYGDYMQLPPPEKRISHGYEAYFIDQI